MYKNVNQVDMKLEYVKTIKDIKLVLIILQNKLLKPIMKEHNNYSDNMHV